MAHKSIVTMLLLVLLCSLVPASASMAATTPHADEVVLAIDSRPSLLCPLTANSAYTSMLWNLIAESPIGMTPKGELYAGLCSTVPSTANGDLVRNANGTVLTTFRLRPGLVWSDGVPITIDDYISAHKLYVSNKVQVISGYPMSLVTDIKRIDDLTCTVTWSQWDPYIPCGWEIYPKHILGPLFDKDPNLINTCDYLKNPVHAGPYVLVTNSDAATTFKANPLYWQKGKPYISRVTVQYQNNPAQLASDLVAGKLDVVSELFILTDAQAFNDAHSDQFTVLLNDSTGAGIMEWNLTSPWFSDKRVRQAFYYGINRRTLTAIAGTGRNAVMSPLSSGSDYFVDCLSKYSYSVDKANALLDDAGWKWNAAHTERILPDGTAAVLPVQTSGSWVRLAELSVIKPELAKLGITLKQANTSFETILANEKSGNFVINIHGISFDAYDLSGTVNQFHSAQIPTAANGMSGSNVTRYSNPEMDTWIDAVQKATTVTDLKTAYTHIQDIWAEDLPCLYLEQTVYPDIVSSGLRGYDHTYASASAYCMWNIAEWRWNNLVNVTSEGNAAGGSISGTSSLLVNDGESAVFQVSVAQGYKATVSAGTLNGSTWTIPNITADTSATVTFAKAGHSVTITMSGDAAGGSVAGPSSVMVNDGASAVFHISTASGYAASVSAGTLSGSTWTIPNITADMHVTITFTKTQTTLTLILQIGSTRMTISGDGSSTVILDAAPVLGVGNRTLVPVRAVAEAMGGTVDWNAATKTASVSVGSNTLELTLGKSTAYYNGAATAIDTDSKVVPVIINGRTMLPLRFVVESLGADVSYDQATKTITITYTKD